MQNPNDEIPDYDPGYPHGGRHPDMAAVSLALLVGAFILWALGFACFHAGRHYMPIVWHWVARMYWVTRELLGH